MSNILIVDDEKSIRITMKEILYENGYNILLASNYDEAIVVLKNELVDLIISDIILSGKSGIELLKYVKKNHKIPVIIITGRPDLETSIQAIKYGASDYIPKPVSADHILNAVDKIVKYNKLLKIKSSLDKENRRIRKRLEELLKEKENSLLEIQDRFKSVTEFAADAIIITNEDCDIIEINKSAKKLFGYNESEFNTLKLNDIINDVFDVNKNANNDILKIKYGETKSGRKIPVEVSVSNWMSGKKKYFSAFIRDIREKLKIESKLHLLSNAVEQSAKPIVITDTNGNIEYVNAKFTELTGYKSKEIIGKNTRIFKSGNKSKEEYKELWDTILEGKDWRGEFYNKKKDGSFYWEHSTIAPIMDANNNINKFLAIKEDITARKEAERIQEGLLKLNNILQEEKNHNELMLKIQSELKSLLSVENFFIAFYDKENKELFFPFYNDLKEKFDRIPAKGTLSNLVIQKRKSVLLNKAEIEELINEKVAGLVGSIAEVWAGVPILVDEEPIGVIAIQDYKDQGAITEKELEILRFVANQVSISTERIKAKEKIEEEKEELSVTLHSLAEAVITTDLNGKILLANPAAQSTFNIKKELLLQNSIFTLFWSALDDGIGKMKLFYNNIKMGGKHFSDEQFTIRIGQRKSKIITVNSSSLITKNTNLHGVVFVIRDMTQQINMENQLALSQKMESIGQLSAGIAHEINTPMQYIGDNTFFLKDSFTEIVEFYNTLKSFINEKCDSEVITKFKELTEETDFDFLVEEIPSAIEQSQVGIERVRTIVSAMKDFAHPGKKSMQFADLNKSIEVTSTISKNEWKYAAELKLNLQKDLPQVECLPDELNQVLLNLIVNAAHAIESKSGKDGNTKGLIEISTKTGKGFVEIIVKDNGSGMPQNIINRVFDPFFTTKEVGKGTGQGLAIAHNIIVNKHKGKINVESTPGLGSKFRIRLPIGN